MPFGRKECHHARVFLKGGIPVKLGGIVIEILIFVSYILFMYPQFARLASRLQQRVLGMLL